MVLTAPFVGLAGQPASAGTIRRLATMACVLGLGSYPAGAQAQGVPFRDNWADIGRGALRTQCRDRRGPARPDARTAHGPLALNPSRP